MSLPVSSHSTLIHGRSGSVPEQSTKLGKKKQWARREVRKNTLPQETRKKQTTAIRGKNFSDMSITERFVFVLGLFSGVQSVYAQSNGKSNICSVASPAKAELSTCPKAGFPEWVTKLEKTGRKDDAQTECQADECSAPKEIILKKRSTPKRESKSQFCHKPSLMEQIGPENRMTGVYKKSDETGIVLGIQNPESVPVMKKYKDLVRLESKTLQLKKILQQTNIYIHINNNDFGMLVFDEKQLTVLKKYEFFPLNRCMRNLFDELDSYDTALKEIFMYQKESGDYKAYAEELDHLIKGRNAVFVSLLQSLKSKFDDLERQTSTALKVNSDHKKEDILQHRKYINSQIRKSQAILSPVEIKKMFQQCIKDRQACLNEHKRTEARELAERVRARREANNNSFTMKFFNLVSVASYTFYLLCMLGSTLALMPLPKKITRYFTYRKKIDTSRLLEKIIRTEKKKMPVDIKKSMDECDRAEDAAISSHTSTKLTFIYPDNWEHASLSFYHDLTRIKKNKRLKKSQSIGAIAKKIKDIVVPKDEFPARPWKEDIPLNHQCIRPIYKRGFIPSSKETGSKNIVAYAYFDPSSDAIKSTISDNAIKKMQSIHETGRYAPHETGATGYKCFRYNGMPLWEFKVAGNERVYGLMIQANEEGRQAGVAPLVIFDTILNKKL
ncbi:hypothetical protein [Endozoicomonas sp. 8E]|uniref:hypothetical protein n=1 Tax=Endozoicomonas sp. 8E TaxID=3035692 RepID=UPI002938EF47|nr:hypothetical protein [Endozoicomonas sp. 8E]WOG29661.1 hypothetical protein P6910_08400 [Endozoicomonas sp. 8E]